MYKKRLKTAIFTALKVFIAVAALSYVFRKIDVYTVWENIKGASAPMLLLSFLLLYFAQVASSLRLKCYLESGGLHAGRLYSTALYFVGMFYNLFLPGSIGGDGYIAYHLKKHHQMPVLRSVRLIFASRANGLFFMNLGLFALAAMSDYIDKIPYSGLAILTLFLLQMPVYALASKYLFRENFALFIKAGKYSFFVQLLNTLSAMAAMAALGHLSFGQITDYTVLFMLSSIMIIFPLVPPGGVGVREFIFLEGSKIAALNPEFGVTFSICFLALYALSSMTGLIFIFRLKSLGEREKLTLKMGEQNGSA